jgi:GTP-binding protein
MFFDEVSLELEGGQGGNGMVSFHREKFIAYGPPDGGDGGKGGQVYFLADDNFNTFRHFSGKKHFKAERGKGGHKNNMTGRGGEDLEIKVPVGTLVFDSETGDLLADLKEAGQKYLAATGGRGGFGNAHFVSSTRQAPNFAELGDHSEKKAVRLELRLLADVGLVGFPSAGKSTLISHVSSAKPKIGDYPFTTLVPNLGVVYLNDFGGSESQSFVLADIPGIIEGASEGKGLGDTFLKHISRSASLLFLLDPFAYDGKSITEQFSILRSELERYSDELKTKDFYVAINKIDAIPEEDRQELKNSFLKENADLKDRFHMISAVSGENLSPLLFELWKQSDQMKALEESEQTAAEFSLADHDESSDFTEYAPIRFVDEQDFDVELRYTLKAGELESPVYGKIISDAARPERTLFAVTGKRIEQISRMTNTAQEDAIQRIYDVLKKMGIQDALLSEGAKSGDYVKIGPHIYEFHDLNA